MIERMHAKLHLVIIADVSKFI